MSTITITFEVQALDFSPLTRGQVDVVFNNGGTNITLTERLTLSPSTTGYFQEVPWVGGLETSLNYGQAVNFAQAFNRDYSRVGGNGVTKNLIATVVGNTVTITATNGTFDSGSYNGNVIVVGGFTINNTPQVQQLSLSPVISTTGTCTTVQYSATASGGVQPYVLKSNSGTIVTDWDGTTEIFNLTRGVVENLRLIDANLDEKIVNVIVPRKLAEGDFDIEVTGYETSSDILINRSIVIANTSRLEYSLDQITESSGTDYQSINSFTGVANGQYRVFIKDVFGCEIYKTINVSAVEDNIKNEAVRYFNIMEGQSIIFNEFKEFDAQTKKNYFNTGSYNEAILGQRYRTKHYFSPNDGFQGIQFKSSYKYHAVTLHHSDGDMVDIPFVMISENLGVVEKMDCVRFPLTETTTGVYFNGGNTYIPDTTTVNGTNIYDGITPAWAKVGQLVYLDGSGLRITGTGYDESKGWYFIVNATTGSEASSTVQLTYNKHDYNTFEMYIDTSIIEPCDVIVVEKGFDPNVYDGNQWVSEQLHPLSDNDEYLLIRWNDVKNKSDIVFQSGISFMARIKGKIIPDSEDKSETYSGDSNEYSIEQVRRLSFEVTIEGITFKQVMQLNIASALDGFSINGLNLVCNSAPEKNRLGESNLWKWKGKFSYGNNLVALQQDEIVLSAGTGVVGGGSTGKSATIDVSDVVLFTHPDGNLAIYQDGSLVKR